MSHSQVTLQYARVHLNPPFLVMRFTDCVPPRFSAKLCYRRHVEGHTEFERETQGKLIYLT